MKQLALLLALVFCLSACTAAPAVPPESILYLGGAPILEDVEEFSAVLASDSLLRVTMTVRGEEFSIFLFARDSAVQSASASHGAEAEFKPR